MFGLNRRHINNGHTAQLLYILQLGRKVAIIHLVKVRASKGLHKTIMFYITPLRFSFYGNFYSNLYIYLYPHLAKWKATLAAMLQNIFHKPCKLKLIYLKIPTMIAYSQFIWHNIFYCYLSIYPSCLIVIIRHHVSKWLTNNCLFLQTAHFVAKQFFYGRYQAQRWYAILALTSVLQNTCNWHVIGVSNISLPFKCQIIMSKFMIKIH